MTEGSGLHSVFRIRQIPKSYKEYTFPSADGHSPWSPEKTDLLFSRFLNTLLIAEVRTAFRVEATNGMVRFSYALPESSSAKTFESVYDAHFQDFVIADTSVADASNTKDDVHICMITGVPKKSENALDAMTEILARFEGTALYQALLTPARPSRVRRSLAKRRLKSSLERAQTQRTESGWFGQEIRPEVHVDSLLASEDFKTQYERLSTDRVFKCQVTLAFWNHPDAEVSLKAAVNALNGSISTTNKKIQLKTRYCICFYCRYGTHSGPKISRPKMSYLRQISST